MNYLHAILLGIAQGLTEFLPVSSSGHLVILQRLFQLDAESPEMIFFDLLVHLGTVVAILFYYRKSVAKYVSHLLGSLSGLGQPLELYQRSASVRFSVLAVAAIFVTGVIYKVANEWIESGFEKPWIVAVCWLITATVLLITDRKRQARRGLREFTIWAALFVGLAQGAAMFPGISRSGSTICAAVLLGLHRRWAGEFSFLIGVPTIILATVIKGREFFGLEGFAPDWGPMLLGAIASAITGWAALALLIWALRKARLKIFSAYCVLIAVATLIAISMGKL